MPPTSRIAVVWGDRAQESDMTRRKSDIVRFSAVAMLVMGASAVGISPAAAEHSWGNYHWLWTGGTSKLVQLGDNVGQSWKKPTNHLTKSSGEWSTGQNVIITEVVSGGTRARQCKPTEGKVEVCSEKYGFNGWLGLAQIWISGSHITQGIVKLNDSYFNTSTYGTAPWRNLVMCQEIGHTFGLGHVDESFGPPNLGTCMDYTNDPTGGGEYKYSNEEPNSHDYAQLEIIYDGHDGSGAVVSASNFRAPAEPGGDSSSEWGKAVAFTEGGKGRVFVKDLGSNRLMVTHVFWTEEAGGRRPH